MVSEAFYSKIRITATAVPQVFDGLGDILAVYWARGYSTVSDEELAANGITRAQLSGMITLAEQVALFRSGQATSAVNHDAILNQLRQDV